MNEETQKWVILDGGGGWQIIMPNADKKPHGHLNGRKPIELAWMDCPCKPKVDLQKKIITHNSFENQELEHLFNQ